MYGQCFQNISLSQTFYEKTLCFLFSLHLSLAIGLLFVQRKSLLEVIKETVLSHLTKKCPPHVSTCLFSLTCIQQDSYILALAQLFCPWLLSVRFKSLDCCVALLEKKADMNCWGELLRVVGCFLGKMVQRFIFQEQI